MFNQTLAPRQLLRGSRSLFSHPLQTRFVFPPTQGPVGRARAFGFENTTGTGPRIVVIENLCPFHIHAPTQLEFLVGRTTINIPGRLIPEVPLRVEPSPFA